MKIIVTKHFVHIANLKSIVSKSKTWIYEWLIIYLFILGELILFFLISDKNYYPTIVALICVVSILSIKLISIEMHRIKTFHGLIKLLEITTVKDEEIRNWVLNTLDHLRVQLLKEQILDKGEGISRSLKEIEVIYTEGEDHLSRANS